MLAKALLQKSSAPCIIVGSLLMAAALILSLGDFGSAASKLTTVAELALYQGPDREQILIEGAKREGGLTFYSSNTWVAGPVVQAFEKKYPFIKISAWRSDSKTILKRVTEEYASGRYLVDVIEASSGPLPILLKSGILQEHTSPEIQYYGDDVKAKGKTGVYYWANREIYISLGFNTKQAPPAEAPKTLKDLLDPKWKGRMSVAGTTTGALWVGNSLEVMGREYLEKMAGQDIKVQNISGAALANLVVSGEVPLSPTIFDSNIFVAKQKGAPVEWRPLEPVIASVGESGMTTKAPHPHAALLFLDYMHSKEGQQVALKGGLSSPREDMASLEKKFKKSYLENKYPIEEFEKKMNEWESLLRQLFIRKR
jgi:iron(III) transport system substrate-binding protein